MRPLTDLRLSALTLLVLSAAASLPAQSQSCARGTFSTTGSAPCEQASPGFFVPNEGATAQTPAPPGRYVPTAGSTNALDAAPGFYVPTSGQSAQTIAPAGTFVDSFEATAPTPAPPGRYVPTAGSTNALDAEPGRYVPTSGQSVQTIAPVGTFVDTFGATAPMPAPPGRYVPNAGATMALDAEPGFYVPTSGQSAPTIAPVGTFVDTFGATAPMPAPPGRYVPNAGATMALDAEPGFYVPTSGQSAPTIAPLGTFVDTVGATAPTPAPVGSYVDSEGAVEAVFAPAGRYVPTAGASSPSVPDAGFYTYAPGASEQVAAGLVAAPMNTTIRSMEASLAATQALIRLGSDERLQASVYYQTGSVAQPGQSSGNRQSISLWGLNVVADIAGQPDNAAGVFAGLTGSNYSASQDGSGNGLGFNVGVFKQLKLGSANVVGSLSYGYFGYDTTRTNISQGMVLGEAANLQRATSSSHVNVYSANLTAAIPIHIALPDLEGFADLAVTGYQGGGFSESASGSGSNPSAALNVQSSNYLSVPVALGVRYSVKDTDDQNSLFSVSLGYKYDFGSSSTINFTAQSVPNYQFGTPIGLSNKGAFFAALSSANYEIARNLYLNAAISTELSSSYEFFQASINLTKRF